MKRLKNSLFAALFLVFLVVKAAEAGGLSVAIQDAGSSRFDVIASTTVNSQFSVLISLSLNNLTASSSQTLFNLSGIGNTTLLTLSRIDSNAGYSYGFTYQWNFGYSGNSHNDDYPYRIPYSVNDTFRVGQEYFGAFSHQNTHAIDWTMPEGTKIHAARGGTVIDLKEDSNEAGTDQRHLDLSNYVTIGHDDGSQANYAHLQQNGALVELGDSVRDGQLIGLSGNTGFSTGPHLHFVVRQQKSPADVSSVATLFVDKDGQSLNSDGNGTLSSLVEGREYQGSADSNQTATAQSIRSSTILDGSSKWRTGSWLGTFYDPGQSWLFHPDLGWLYPVDSDTSSAWLYHSTRGWIWSNKSSYPWLYFQASAGWKYLFHELGLYDSSSDEWETLSP